MMVSPQKLRAYTRKKEYPYMDKSLRLTTAKIRLDLFVKGTAKNIVSLITKNGQKEDYCRQGTSLSGSMPFNVLTGHKFTRINQILCLMYMMDKGLDDTRFIPVDQVKEVGGSILKNETVTLLAPVIKKRQDIGLDLSKGTQDPDLTTGRNLDLKSDEIQDENLVFFRPQKVINACHVDNMPVQNNEALPIDWAKNDVLGRLVAASGVDVAYGSKRSRYVPLQNTIKMPVKDAFGCADEYYALKMLKWYYATGSKGREDRFDNAMKCNGVLEYALEIFRARCFSMMLGKVLGLPVHMALSEEDVMYWKKQITQNPQVLVTEAVRASDTLDIVMQFVHDQQPSARWFPDKSTWPGQVSDAAKNINRSGMVDEKRLWEDIKVKMIKMESWFEAKIVENLPGKQNQIVFETSAHGDIVNGRPGQKDVDEALRIAGELNKLPCLEVEAETMDEKVMVVAKYLGLMHTMVKNQGPGLFM
ncbi:MAG: DUF1738 domain-containing protein [Desulfobacteraceae bacterium]|nr:DUF1738 domain-containing protein [Desulfobacteraceae bacterium]